MVNSGLIGLLAKGVLVLLACLLQVSVASKDKRSMVCYGDLGCFSTGGAFTSLTRLLNLNPESPATIHTRFLLYTRQNAATGSHQFMDPDDFDSMRNSVFNGSKPTKAIIHGFLDNGLESWLMDMKDALLKYGDYNVILVDWGGGSGIPYTQATANTRVVGAVLAKLIRGLHTHKSAEAENFHLIGHSLGAHVAGYAGERTPNLARISGLDPADPYFQFTDPEVRLDPSDATFVDVMHTNGVSILELGYGMVQACGHVDYYPNKGLTQPGCAKGAVEKLRLEGDIYEGGKQIVACSHLRAYTYFTESINSRCPFSGYACKTYEDFHNGLCLPCSTHGCGYMGYHADKIKPAVGSVHNKFYLETGDISPFCRFHYQVDVEFGQLSGANTETGTMFMNLAGTNGQIGERQITPEPIDVQPGHTYHFLLTSTHDLGEINEIDFRWSLDSHWYKPSSWTLLTTHSVRINAVNVINGETEARKRFCGFNAKINTDSTEMMTYSC